MDKNHSSHILAKCIEALSGYGAGDVIPLSTLYGTALLIAELFSPTNIKPVRDNKGQKKPKKEVLLLGEYRNFINKPYVRIRYGSNGIWSVVTRQPQMFDETKDVCYESSHKKRTYDDCKKTLLEVLKTYFPNDSSFTNGAVKIAGLARAIVKAELDVQFVMRNNNQAKLDMPIKGKEQKSRPKRRFEDYTGPRTNDEGRAYAQRDKGQRVNYVWKTRPMKYIAPNGLQWLLRGGNYPKFMRSPFELPWVGLNELYNLALQGLDDGDRWQQILNNLRNKCPFLDQLIMKDRRIGLLKNFMDKGLHAIAAVGINYFNPTVLLPIRDANQFVDNDLDMIERSKVNYDLSACAGSKTGHECLFSLSIMGVLFSDTAIIKECFGVSITYEDVLLDKRGFRGVMMVAGRTGEAELGPIFNQNAGIDIHANKEHRHRQLDFIREESAEGSALEKAIAKIENSPEDVSIKFRDLTNRTSERVIHLNFKNISTRTRQQEERRNTIRLNFRQSADAAKATLPKGEKDVERILRTYKLPNCSYVLGSTVFSIGSMLKQGSLDDWKAKKTTNANAFGEIESIIKKADGTKKNLRDYFFKQCQDDPAGKFDTQYSNLLQWIGKTATIFKTEDENQDGMDVVDGAEEATTSFETPYDAAEDQQLPHCNQDIDAKSILYATYTKADADGNLLPTASSISKENRAAYNTVVTMWNNGTHRTACEQLCKTAKADVLSDFEYVWVQSTGERATKKKKPGQEAGLGMDT